MPFDIAEATELYKNYARIPSYIDGKIIPSLQNNIFNITCIKSLRNLEESSKSKFAVNYTLSENEDEVKIVSMFQPLEISSESVASISKSGNKRLVIRTVISENKEKQYLEVWSNDTRLHNISVDESKVHGKINTDDQFGAFQWSENESQVLFIAESFKEKTQSFLKKPSNSDEKEKVIYGEEYLYNEDWGEQLNGKCSPVPCIFDVISGEITALDFLPKSVSYGPGIWGKNGEIYVIGYFHENQRLGLMYCTNRRSAIFKIIPSTKQYEIIGSQDNAVNLLLMSPQKTKLIFFESSCLGPHRDCPKLKMYDGQSIKVVVGPFSVPDENGFPGLYPIKQMFWDENNLIVSSYWRSHCVLLNVNLVTGVVTRLTEDEKIGSWTLLDVRNKYILASASSLDVPPHLVIGVVKCSDNVSVRWNHFKDPGAENFNLDIKWEILKFSPEHGNNSLEYEAIYAEPSKNDGNLPLIVWPHGGPHSVFCPAYNFPLTLFTQMGYSVLQINYRGSLGFGQSNIESLLGTIGDQDVKDVQQSVVTTVSSKSINPKRIYLFGGSHGGFLVTHLMGQYPDFYSACVARNPVVEIGCNADVSDIPDWSWAEAGIGNDVTERSLLTPDVRKVMWEKSPMKNIDFVKTPTLFLVGLEDRRVSSTQAMKFYRALKARNVITKMFIYKDCHPLSKVAVEVDCTLNTLLWFNKY